MAEVSNGEEPKNESKAPTARDRVVNADSIGSLRERLYARGKAPEQTSRHPLAAPGGQSTERSDTVRRAIYDASLTPKTAVPHTAVPEKASLPTLASIDGMIQKKRARAYRLKLALGAVVFFVGALLVSSGFLFFGNNTISGENITVDVSGPLAVGGGEELDVQIKIANNNAVPIEAATLIVNYPQGTQSATESGKEQFSERLQRNNIQNGEVVNVPIRALVFGEENEEKEVTVAVEYRIAGSNATFYKEAAPLRFKISTSPIVMNIESVKSISSGQRTEIKLTVQSNSPNELTDVLVKATYPYGFEVDTIDPDPVSGKDTWRIPSLKPEEKRVITIAGIVMGKEDEVRRFGFSAGVPNERDQFNLASILSTASMDMIVEQPFLGVRVTVNDDAKETVAIQPGVNAGVRVEFDNELDDTIYDGIVRVELMGNALDEVDVKVDDGFYDSSKNVITWDSVDVDSLKQIGPGRTGAVTFTLEPRADISETPELSLRVTVEAKRVFEDRVPQTLVGTVERTVKIASVVRLASSALYTEGPFTNTGPTPPVAEEVTQYTFLLTANTGTNAVASAEVTAVVPQYVKWLDLVSEGDTVTYSSVNRTLTWKIGNMDANDREEVWVQISFLPSLTQVGKTPTLLETQRFKAPDRFTGTVIRADAPALTTELFNDPDPAKRDGDVQAP